MQSVRTSRVEVVGSRSGVPNIEVDGVPYHSPYDPEREAARFYSGLRLEEADVVIQYGWGLGYAGPILRERIRPESRVIVLEPDDEVAGVSRSESPGRDDPRFTFVSGPEVDQFFDLIADDCQETDKFLWIDWPRTVQMTGDHSERVHETFDRRIRDKAANLLTHFQNGTLYFENALANLKYAGDPVVGRLFGRFRNVPLVLVSAGPSLDRNIRDLRGMEARCFILAVDTALRPLLEAGVVPHAVAIADPSELNARHILGALPPETYLIAEQASHPLAMADAKRRFQFSVGVFPDSLYSEFGLERTTLNVWGSVATAALDLVCKLGVNPVIFLGQDCAYTWGRDYARHTIFDNREFDPSRSTHTEIDLFGQPVPTTENLVAYRDSILRRIGTEDGTRFINATEGGILDGAPLEILSLRDALAQTATRRVDVSQRLDSLHRVNPSVPDMRAHLASALRAPSGRCGCRDGYLDLSAKEAVLRNDQDGIKPALRLGVEIAGQHTASEDGVDPIVSDPKEVP